MHGGKKLVYLEVYKIDFRWLFLGQNSYVAVVCFIVLLGLGWGGCVPLIM